MSGRMKKVGLVSVRNYNYGSILQAFALQKVLDSMNIDNEIIYYIKKSYGKQVLRIFNKPLLIAKCKDVYKKIYGKYINREIGYILSKREKAFKEFINDNLRFSEPYIGRKSLEENAINYKAFILGSDQVWNPMNLGSDYYTLTFIPNEIMKITYASSFGVSIIPNTQISNTKEYLSRIQYISVREDSGSNIINELIGRQVPVVVDPTLLFDSNQWDSFILDSKLEDDDYIFCYFVGANREHREAVKKLKEITGCKVILIPHVDEIVKEDIDLSNDYYSNVGPSEFINLIKHAKYVCTDSFHASIFSIHYKKKFFVFNRFNSNTKHSMNTRLGSLLGALDLNRRFVSERNDLKEWYDEEIDYSKVHDNLVNLRKKSQDYLQNIASVLEDIK